MIVYAESSAVLQWLLAEPHAAEVIRILESAATVVTSEITGIECSRAIHRAASRGALDGDQTAMLLRELTAASTQWDRLELRDRVAALASGPFPVEPVRSLDAIHLASAIVARDVWRDLAVLSFDERVRSNAAALGLAVLPGTN